MHARTHKHTHNAEWFNNKFIKKQANQTNKKQTIDHKFYATKKRRQSQKMQALGNLICDTIAMREGQSGDDDIEKRLGKGGGEGREGGAIGRGATGAKHTRHGKNKRNFVKL